MKYLKVFDDYFKYIIPTWEVFHVLNYASGIPSDQIWPGLVKIKNNIFTYFNTNLYYRLQNRLLLSQYKHANG